jgi:hypothetical protein
MKALSIAGLAMIAIILFLGIVIILVASSGFTPVYYHSLPEIDYINLLSSYLHAKTNIERTLTENAGDFFSTIAKYPIKWERWNNYALFEQDFKKEFANKLKQMGEKYFSSVYNIELVDLKFESVSSEVNYVPTTLSWDYTYKINLQRKLAGEDIFNEIDTVDTIHIDTNYLNLEDAYNCISEFFGEIEIKTFSFIEEDKYKIELALTEIFRETLEDISDCNSFTKKVNVEVFCSGKCDCKSIKSAKVTLVLDDKIAFYDEYKNFICGENSYSCNTGSDCCASGSCRDCVSFTCTSCTSISLGKKCSPAGSLDSSNNYRCYETDTGEYKCLKYFPNIRYLLNDEYLFYPGTINLNCGTGEYKFKVLGLPNYYIKYSGVKVYSASNLDLCDITKIPRVNSKLEIYAIYNSYNYKVDDIKLNFDLPYFIDELNSRMSKLEPYEFSASECNELKSSLSDLVSNIIDELLAKLRKDNPNFMNGYQFNIEADICDSGITTPSQEKYGIVKIEIKDSLDKIITNLFYEIEFIYPPYG